MDNILDRTLQLEILKKLAEVYPEPVYFDDFYEFGTTEYRKAIANAFYLQSKGLLEPKSILVSQTLGRNENSHQFGAAKISALGMDFLADDGGLSAILNTVTVKIDQSQMADFLKAIANLSQEEQKTLFEAIKEAPSKAVETMVEKSVEKGFDNLPAWAALAVATFN